MSEKYWPPSKAIEQLREFEKNLNRLRCHLANEISEVGEQWDQLKRIGGARDDHAASLLGKLRHHLAHIAKLCGNTEKQIDQMIADPFGRHAEAKAEAELEGNTPCL